MTPRRGSSAGFTLVELMGSLAGGLLLAIGVFMLSKETSALYQRETRAATATLASVVGFERLRADIARAGFMASPNIRRDPFVCGRPATDPNWPELLSSLSSIRIENMDTSELPDLFADNGLAPQRILLAGNYSSAEAFPIRTIYPTADDVEVHLQVETGAMSRIGYNAAGADREAVLRSVFPPGRAVRIVDKSGRHHYGVLESVSVVSGPVLILSDSAPAVQFRDGSGIGCGLKGEETGATINAINFIRYELRSLDGVTGYAPIYDVEGPAYDADRTELVREELDPEGNAINGSQELVAEYAVDLRFRVTVAPSQRSPLAYVEQANLASWVGDPATLGPGAGPQLVRTVHTWLSVRSREADRTSGIDTESGPLFRIGLGSEGSAPFARVRTVQARIALHNQMGVTWQ
jgi:hypothetical protein